MDNAIFIGWDPREHDAFDVARQSCRRHLTRPIAVRGLVLADLERRGIYTRPYEYRASAAGRPVMWDVISDAPQSTEHANARFLVRHLAGSGWALFADGDVLFRGNVARLFDSLRPEFAVYCVKHRHEPDPGYKMDSQIQTRYVRKNWSSVMAINCDHPANRALTLDLINSVPGRDLHRFCWLNDEDIGELGPEWNFLVGITHAPVDPQIVHFTEGVPNMHGYQDVAFADEWRAELLKCAA